MTEAERSTLPLTVLPGNKICPDCLKHSSYFETVTPDALIIQDLGIVNLVMDHFPSLEIHGSTLMAIHNRAGVQALASLGFSRVVIAREYTLKEIDRLIRQAPIEIEVFIHGAMCFSYSGLCMFSSYLGGKSGLRGKCVQPCRRKYSLRSTGKSGGKTAGSSGYLFSMNDLNGLEMVPEFMKMGVSALKIEGRLRSATYVKNIVTAYRMMVDAGPRLDRDVFKEASALVPEAMGRRTSSGYFRSPQPTDAIVQAHSGNIGNHLGRVSSIETSDNETFICFKPKKTFKSGDRLRLHVLKGDTRKSFTVDKLVDQSGVTDQVEKKGSVRVLVPDSLGIHAFQGPIDVYLVDVRKAEAQISGVTAEKRLAAALDSSQKKNIADRVRGVSRQVLERAADKPGHQVPKGAQKKVTRTQASELWLRIDSARQILGKQPFIPERYVINIDRTIMGFVGDIKRFLGRNMRSVIWALPAVLSDSSFDQMKKSLATLIRSGFRTFQIAHLSQIELFEGERVQLYGDYTLNLMNSQALSLMSKLDFRGFQLSIEMSRDLIQPLIDGYRSKKSRAPKIRDLNRSAQLGLTVYGAPPLFVSRIASKQLPYGKIITSPKNEQFVVDKKEGHSITRPKKPFSLLPFRKDLEQMGLQYLVVDISGMRPGNSEMAEIYERIRGKGTNYKLPTFNYLGTLE